MNEELIGMLNRSDELLNDLKREYNNCYINREVTERAKNLTHEILEKLRHSLDHAMFLMWEKYIAEKISENDRKKAKIYFPIVKKQESFNQMIRKNFRLKPEDMPKDLHDFLLNNQPFNSDKNSWLYKLTTIVGEGKHTKYKYQDFKESHLIKYTRQENGSLAGGQKIWIACFIEGYDLDASNFCEEAIQKTQTLVGDMVNKFKL